MVPEDPCARRLPSRVPEPGSSYFFSFVISFLALWIPLYRVEASSMQFVNRRALLMYDHLWQSGLVGLACQDVEMPSLD